MLMSCTNLVIKNDCVVGPLSFHICPTLFTTFSLRQTNFEIGDFGSRTLISLGKVRLGEDKE